MAGPLAKAMGAGANTAGKMAGAKMAGDEESPQEDANPADNEDSEGEGEPPSEDEQGLYEELVHAAQSIIYSKDGQIVDKLKAEPDPAKSIGHTAAMIGMSLKQGLKQKGIDVPDETLLAAGREVVAELMEVAAHAGIIEDAGDEKIFRQAMMWAAKFYGEALQNAGAIDPKQRAQAQVTTAKVMQAVGKDRAARRGPTPGAQNIASAMQEEG